jgi:urate oxidase
MTVCVLLAGDIETSYTKADNSVVVATDSTKNTIHILAKQTPVNPPELFASTLATHFVNKYSHIHETFVKVITHRWTRLEVDGKPHPHSFHRDGVETRNVDVHYNRNGGLEIRSSIVGLHVLKTTGSQFHGFVRDEFTTLKETWDRILSTEVDAVWEWKKFGGLEEVKQWAAAGKFDKAWELARYVTLKTFCEDNSASVQATMYKMAQEIIEKAPGVEHVEYSLPNKHFFEIGKSQFENWEVGSWLTCE